MSETLQNLTWQMGAGDVSSRAELEAKLARLLRLILRTGQAYPSLLEWVRSALPAVAAAWRFDDPVDPEWAALHLARRLCSQLLQDVHARRDTIVSRQTVIAR